MCALRDRSRRCIALGMSDYTHPGQLVSDLLRERGWTSRALAIVLEKDESTINKIVSGKGSVTTATALALEDVFGVEADRFLTLQKQHDLAVARLSTRPDRNRATRAALFADLPIGVMIKRGWISAEDENDLTGVSKGLTRFFGVQSLDDIEILPHAAKKTNVNADATPTQMAWLYRVKTIAEELMVPPYSRNKLIEALPRLRSFVVAAEETRQVPRILSECGVRFVIVETLPSAKIDGVCFWLNETSPVIGLSMRNDRIDNFWFVLRHEIEHVIQGHGQSQVILDAELEGERAGVGADIPEEEKVANAAAQEFCVPKAKMDAFIARKAPFFSERDMLGLARIVGVHPGIVAGQLQHRTGRYDRFRKHLEKVRAYVSPGAAIDGWGDVYPVSE